MSLEMQGGGARMELVRTRQDLARLTVKGADPPSGVAERGS